MTRKELAKIAHRVSVATSGEWCYFQDNDDEWSVAIPNQDADDGWYYIATTHSEQGGNDAEFIAHAKRDIQSLLLEVERLNQKLGVE